MLRPALALALALACTPGSDSEATKPGDTVLTWELASSDRESIRAATIREVKSIDLDFDGQVTPDGEEVKVKVHLETATVEFVEDGATVTHAAPIKLSITAVDAAGFTLSASSCNGPHYTMDLPPAHDMTLHCYVKAKKPRYDVGFTIYAYGDGRIDDGRPKP